MTILALGAGYVLARTCDQGFANSLGMVTVRHGTDPLTWAKIHIMGAGPSDDKSKLISDKFSVVSSSSEFGIDFSKIFALLDSKFHFSAKKELLPQAVLAVAAKIYQVVLHNRLVNYIKTGAEDNIPFMKYLYSNSPIAYVSRKALMHGVPLLQKFAANIRMLQGTGKISKVIGATIFTMFTPVLKFRYRKDQMAKLFNEPEVSVGNVILVSNTSHSIFNMGLLGSLKNSLCLRMPPLFTDPIKVLTGTSVVLLTAGVALGGWYVFPGFVAAHQTALIAGAIFAVL